MATATATFFVRIISTRGFHWIDPMPEFTFIPGTAKTWDLNEAFVNGFAPQERPEFGLVLTAPELVGAFDVVGDALRYNGAPLTLPDRYVGWVSLVAARRENHVGARAIDGAGREWLLVGRQLDGDGAPGAILVDSGGPLGHDFLRVPAGGSLWEAWHIEADAGLVYSLVGDDNLEWFVHDPETLQPSAATEPADG